MHCYLPPTHLIPFITLLLKLIRVNIKIVSQFAKFISCTISFVFLSCGGFDRIVTARSSGQVCQYRRLFVGSRLCKARGRLASREERRGSGCVCVCGYQAEVPQQSEVNRAGTISVLVRSESNDVYKLWWIDLIIITPQYLNKYLS